MQMVYNSDSFVVVKFDVPADPATQDTPARAGFEIVDKFAGREIYIEGAVAEGFKLGVEALSESNPTPEALDEFIAGYTALAQQPVALH